MTDDPSINYGRLMHKAMRGLIQGVLEDVAAKGLPGAHHFFITFRTGHPGVDIADWLRSRYPDEMTVVIQHWFEDLEVDDTGFGITLNFGDSPERLIIPYDSIETFVDPSVEFGLRFESSDSAEEDDGDDATDAPEAPMAKDIDPENAPRPEAEVVSLDKFRK